MLQNSRKNARKPGIIYDYYSELNKVVNECGLNRIDMGCFISNCDESGFGMDPSRINATKIICLVLLFSKGQLSNHVGFLKMLYQELCTQLPLMVGWRNLFLPVVYLVIYSTCSAVKGR